MLWIIILAISCFIAYKVIDYELCNWEIIEYILFVITVVCGVMIGALISILPLSYILPNSVVYDHSVEITALNDNSDVSGRAYLGSGYIEEEQYYYYMSDTSKGKKMNKVLAEHSYVNEIDGTPKIDVYYLEYNFIGKALTFFSGNGYEYIISVPKDTVTTEFNIDME